METHSKELKDWLDFSLFPQSELEIRKRAVNDALYKTHSLCYSYVCRFSKLSEDFIEDLMFITSPFYEIDYDNKENRNFIVDLIDLDITTKSQLEKAIVKLSKFRSVDSRMLSKFHGNRKIKNVAADRLDWFYLYKFQNLSEAFIMKHKTLITKSGILL